MYFVLMILIYLFLIMLLLVINVLFNLLINLHLFYSLDLFIYYDDKFNKSIDFVYTSPLLRTYSRRIPGG